MGKKIKKEVKVPEDLEDFVDKHFTQRGLEVIKIEEVEIHKDYDLDPGQTPPRTFVTTITAKSPFSGN